MIITAALAWYDELPEDLEACVAGIANVADSMVALDGAYRRFPNARVRSPRFQVNAIYSAARNVGLECKVVLPDRLWLGQVEKRTTLMQLASEDSDWVVVTDTDHIIKAEREKIRPIISGIDPEVGMLKAFFETPANKERSLSESASGKWHESQSAKGSWIQHMYRSYPGLQVERYHWWYSALKGSKRVWLIAGQDARMSEEERSRPLVKSAILPKDEYIVEHRCLLRDERHVLENRAFCNDREKVARLTGQEDDKPGLPRPVFDYDRMPA